MKNFRNIFNLLLDLVYFVFNGGAAAARRKGVRVGKDCRIYIRNFGSEPFLITIGDRCTVTSGTRFLTHDGSTSLVRNEKGIRYQKFGPITLGDDVFIGVNSIIMPGITIHSRAVVGAGSVVTRDVPKETVVVGNPARPISDFESFQKRIKDTCPNDSDLEGAENYRCRVELALQIMNERSDQNKL